MDKVTEIKKSFLVEIGAAIGGLTLSLEALGLLLFVHKLWAAIIVTIILGFMVLSEVVGLRTAGPWLWWAKVISFAFTFLVTVLGFLNVTELLITPFRIEPLIITVLVMVAVLDAGLIWVNRAKIIKLLSGFGLVTTR